MDEQYCSLISSSIAEIIRVSTDDDFRRECYQLLNATDTNDCQVKTHEKLLKIQNKMKKRKAKTKVNGTEDSSRNEVLVSHESVEPPLNVHKRARINLPLIQSFRILNTALLMQCERKNHKIKLETL